jgi:hypothetical protein
VLIKFMRQENEEAKDVIRGKKTSEMLRSLK